MAGDSDAVAGDSDAVAGDSVDRAEASHGPRECMPCRGSGQVISNLGGARSMVPCPWCGGSGVRRTGVDAQERWLQANAATAG
jgi:hypothetical protein